MTPLVAKQTDSKPWRCNYRQPGEINLILPESASADLQHRES